MNPDSDKGEIKFMAIDAILSVKICPQKLTHKFQ